MGQTGLSGGAYLRGKRRVDRWDKLGSVEGLTSYFYLSYKKLRCFVCLMSPFDVATVAPYFHAIRCDKQTPHVMSLNYVKAL